MTSTKSGSLSKSSWPVFLSFLIKTIHILAGMVNDSLLDIRICQANVSVVAQSKAPIFTE